MSNKGKDTSNTVDVVDRLVKVNLYIENLNKEYAKKINIGFNQWLILTKIKNMPGTSAQRLAKEIGIHVSTLTQSLKRLNQKNWIIIMNDPRDARRKKIFLSEKGNEVLLQTEKNIDLINDGATKALEWISKQIIPNLKNNLHF